MGDRAPWVDAASQAAEPARMWGVRGATSVDLPALELVERRAAARFGAIGRGELVDRPGLPSDFLARQQALGLVWVAGDPPVGFAAALELADSLHLHEVDVVPEAAGRGLGRALIEAVAAEAARRGRVELTLVTFRDVPWNAPWYGRLGFQVSSEAARRPEIAALRDEERRAGLDALGARVVMARPVHRR